MAINPDFRDLFAALNAAQAKYLVVGGYALAFHGLPRFTKDMDIWVEATPQNAEKVFLALEEFGAPASGLTRADLARRNLIFQIGIAPNRIDVITSIDGVEFHEAWPSREEMTYGDQTLAIIGRKELIRNKRAAGRPQDLTDVRTLETDD